MTSTLNNIDIKRIFPKTEVVQPNINKWDCTRTVDVPAYLTPASKNVFPCSQESMNFYNFYRWILLGVTLYNIGNVVLTVLEYKQYYEKLPKKLRQYLQQQTVRILGEKITIYKKELWINLGLLLLLICLNGISFVI